MMRNIYNKFFKTLLLIVILLGTRMLSFAQDNKALLPGCWVEQRTGIVYEKVEGEFIETNPGVQGNIMRRMVLIPDSIGMYLDENGTIMSTFSWDSTDSIFVYHESPDCPYTERSYYYIKSSATCDTLLFEQRYKNPNYRTRNIYLRSKVTLNKDDSYSNRITIDKRDNYTAYNHRIISDQRPYVYSGSYKDGLLCIANRHVYNWLTKMTVSNVIEVHLLNQDSINERQVDIFLVYYDENSRKIKNVNYITSYLR